MPTGFAGLRDALGAVELPVIVAGAVAAALVVVLVVWVLRQRGRGAVPSAREAGAANRPPEATSRDRLRLAVRKTRAGLFDRIGPLLGRRALDPDAREHLETALLGADVGVRATERLLRRVAEGRDDGETVRARLARDVVEMLEALPEATPSAGKPHVVMVVGVNGVGKTTTIGKLACRSTGAGERVLLVAGDTFRAAAIDQLAIWAERAGAEIVRQQYGGDPGAVAYDGVRAAVARGVDRVLIDTAGRLHTKTNLMQELRKVRRVVEREVPGAPHETLLVLDATTGQNGLAQARAFLDELQVTGIVLTKLDGTAKGGVAVAIAEELGIPIRFVGVGESVMDLQEFDARAFVDALLGDEATGGR
jgi:fused signal recognition particle receptor